MYVRFSINRWELALLKGLTLNANLATRPLISASEWDALPSPPSKMQSIKLVGNIVCEFNMATFLAGEKWRCGIRVEREWGRWKTRKERLERDADGKFYLQA